MPYPLPPKQPPLSLEGKLANLYTEAAASVARLCVAGSRCRLVPLWFRTQRGGHNPTDRRHTSHSLGHTDFESTRNAEHLDDVQEVCNYVEALTYARREPANPKGLPLSIRLLR